MIPEINTAVGGRANERGESDFVVKYKPWTKHQITVALCVTHAFTAMLAGMIVLFAVK